ncbi:MAG: anaerobic ribonucleoside-triphosphate reductase activating protein [Muribaculaceae bacterium]|nr:anaerobic ribonucleoside-triphosphate reductase activating protein [Muribaculaceae bacterium]
MYNVLQIMRGTTVDGPGFRTSIYLAGCNHRCPGCHNPSSWDPEGGNNMTLDEIMEIVEEEDFDVTLSGGDPLFIPQATGILVRALKQNGRNVWVFTGFRWEDIITMPSLLDAVREADVVVDGPFIEDRKDLDLLFRGSSNQRLIRVADSLQSGNITLYDS